MGTIPSLHPSFFPTVIPTKIPTIFNEGNVDENEQTTTTMIDNSNLNDNEDRTSSNPLFSDEYILEHRYYLIGIVAIIVCFICAICICWIGVNKIKNNTQDHTNENEAVASISTTMRRPVSLPPIPENIQMLTISTPNAQAIIPEVVTPIMSPVVKPHSVTMNNMILLTQHHDDIMDEDGGENDDIYTVQKREETPGAEIYDESDGTAGGATKGNIQ